MAVSRKELIHALTNLKRAAGPKSALPILKSILVTVADGMARLVASDLDITMQVTLACSPGAEDGKAAIPADLWLKAVKTSKIPTSTLEVNDPTLGMAIIDGVVAVRTRSANDYPKLGEFQAD